VPQDGQIIDLIIHYDIRDSIFGILGRPANANVGTATWLSWRTSHWQVFFSLVLKYLLGQVFIIQATIRVTACDGRSRLLRIMTQEVDTKVSHD